MKLVSRFFQHEIAPGILLTAAAILAIVIKNTAWSPLYDSIIHYPIGDAIYGGWAGTALVQWVNDGLMTVFFLVVGLELKRAFFDKKLTKAHSIRLPAIAAIGGITVPAIIYITLTNLHPEFHRGWAIPTATDIAFALGVVALLGNRFPKSLKICLLSLAIFDDISAIIIIAIFYSHPLSVLWLVASAGTVGGLAFLNRIGTDRLTPYIIGGGILWICLHNTGIHPTIAGILLGFTIPLEGTNSTRSPLKRLENRLYPWVSYGILPIFAFVNAGISLHGLSVASLTHPITLGVGVGLFLGKQAGVMGASALAIRWNICQLPANTTWRQFYGMAVITGIGFTMSLLLACWHSPHPFTNSKSNSES